MPQNTFRGRAFLRHPYHQISQGFLGNKCGGFTIQRHLLFTTPSGSGALQNDFQAAEEDAPGRA
jgi:hypothetical protein